MEAREVRKLRKRLGLTQAGLSQRLGVTWVTVARWEGGARRIPEPTARLLKSFLPGRRP